MENPLAVTLDDNKRLGPTFKKELAPYDVDLIHYSTFDVELVAKEPASVFIIDAKWGDDKKAGFRLATQLADLRPHVPILMMSRYSHEEEIQEATERQWLRIMNKPWSPEETRAVAEIAKFGPVRLAWASDMHDGAFRGRQPESLSREEWQLIHDSLLRRAKDE